MKLPTDRRAPERTVIRIPIESIAPSPYQPRQTFPEDTLESLAESIRLHGQLTPLLVRRVGPGQYELVAGERRLRALRLLGRSHAEALVMSVFDRDSALIGLIENLHREGLHYLDEAEACRSILDAQQITQEKLAQSLAISASALANRLRLLRLPPAVRCLIRQNGLAERHARALLRLSDEAQQLELARDCAVRRWSVKQLDAHIDALLRPAPSSKRLHGLLRDNRLVVNAVLDAVRELQRIGVNADSRVEEADDRVQVIVTIRTQPQ